MNIEQIRKRLTKFAEARNWDQFHSPKNLSMRRYIMDTTSRLRRREVKCMKLRVVVEPDEDVYISCCPELPGGATYGKTEEEAGKNIMEAAELYLMPSKNQLSKEAKVFEVAL